jgi:hypothetical protein
MKQLAMTLALVVAVTIGCKHMDADADATSATIALTDVPAGVRQGFDKDHPGVTIRKVEKETYKDGTVHYEFEFVDASGKEQDVEYNAEGEQLDKH